MEPPFSGRPRLGDWQVLQSANASFEEQQLIQWQYEAACAIQGQVSATIGRERMQQAIAVLLAGDSPYDRLPGAAVEASLAPSVASSPTSEPTPGPSASTPPRLPPGGLPASAAPTADTTITPLPTPTAGPAGTSAFSPTRSSKRRTRPVDWRQWLDIVDEVGFVAAGVMDLTVAEDLLVTTGVVRRSALRDRADARAAYHALQALAPGGITPVIVRRGLDRWEFETATRDIRLADRVARRIAALPTTQPEVVGLWESYEAAGSRRALQRLDERVPEVGSQGAGEPHTGTATTWSPWVRISFTRMPSSSMDSTSI